MWYPFKFYKNVTHVHVGIELGGRAGHSRSHARAYRRALRKTAMPAAVIAGTVDADLELVGWSTTVMHEFDAYVLGFGAPDGRTYVHTFSGRDTLRFLAGGFAGWRTSLQGVNVLVFRRGPNPPDSVELDLRQIPSLLSQGPS